MLPHGALVSLSVTQIVALSFSILLLSRLHSMSMLHLHYDAAAALRKTLWFQHF